MGFGDKSALTLSRGVYGCCGSSYASSCSTFAVGALSSIFAGVSLPRVHILLCDSWVRESSDSGVVCRLIQVPISKYVPTRREALEICAGDANLGDKLGSGLDRGGILLDRIMLSRCA